MKKIQLIPQRGLSRRAVVARIVGIVSLCSQPLAAEVDHELEEIVVSALRAPRAASDVTASVSVLDPEELAKKGIYQLRDLLNEAPGVIATSTGGETGALGSLLIRGTTTAYSQLVVDGMRLSDSTTPLGSMLGASRVFDLGRVEILRGAQGAAYGGESIGGVLWMETGRGQGDPSNLIFTELGSFESYSAAFRAQGEQHGLSYFFSTAYEETENDAPDQAFHQGSIALRFEKTVARDWLLGVTYRGVDAYYNNLGNSDDRLDASLVTAYAKGKLAAHWNTQLHAGFQQEFYDSDASFGNYGTDMRAVSVSNDHEWEWGDQLRVTSGMFFHRSDFENTIGTAASRDRYGLHTAVEWQPNENWQTYTAVRWEDYAAYGKESTWRVGSSYEISPLNTLVRGGIGSSFRAPSYLDLFGSSYGAGNPSLHAESALGWDLGFVQQWSDDHQFELTWFRNELEDRINSFAVPLPINQSGETVTQGWEMAAKGKLFREDLQYRVAWTCLDRSLSDQPRQHVQASVDWDVSAKFRLGLGAKFLSDHSWGGADLAGYTLLRAHAGYQVSENVRLHARWENITDEDYQLSNFGGDIIDGAGMGLFGGVTVEW